MNTCARSGRLSRWPPCAAGRRHPAARLARLSSGRQSPGESCVEGIQLGTSSTGEVAGFHAQSL